MDNIIANRYELLKEVGRGGMSKVYLAADLNLNKNWAIKKIKKKGNIKGQLIQNSLLAEAEMMKNLDYPSLPKIIDIIEDREHYYIVMDYVEGETLKRILEKLGPQDQEQVIEWAKEITLTLGYLHSQDPPIIYRDMKPANIILQPGGDLKIIDFGIARTYKEGKAGDTAPLGTKGYAAPEQYDLGNGQSAQTDPRTDIFNLGATMYELLTGKVPVAITYRLKPIRERRPDISVGLENIINKCTAPDPADRYQSTEELMYALLNYEKQDLSYVLGLKNTLKKTIIPLILAGFFIICSAGLLTADHFVAKSQYENLIKETGASSQNIENLKRAIEASPERPEAYKALIKEYAKLNDDGISPQSEQEIMTVCAKGVSKLREGSKEYLAINYLLGESALIYYKGKSDDSIRSKILTAQPYFDAVAYSGDESFENYSLAKGYSNLASFYESYILGGSDAFVIDASREEYEELISDFNDMLNLLGITGQNQLKIATYTVMLGIIDMQRPELATNVSKAKVIALLKKIGSGIEKVNTTNASLLNQKKEAISDYERVLKNMEKSYEEAKKGGE